MFKKTLIVLLIIVVGIFFTINGLLNQAGFATNAKPENIQESLFAGTNIQATTSDIDPSLIFGVVLIIFGTIIYYVRKNAFIEHNESQEHSYVTKH